MSVILPVDVETVHPCQYRQCFADSIVLTKSNTLLLQTRPHPEIPNRFSLNAFGGHVEKDESPLQAVIRELNEELGAAVDLADIINLGAVTEDFTQHQDIVYTYFWHDRHGTITGCYEHQPVFFNQVSEILKQPDLMSYTAWMLRRCIEYGLLVG